VALFVGFDLQVRLFAIALTIIQAAFVKAVEACLVGSFSKLKWSYNQEIVLY